MFPISPRQLVFITTYRCTAACSNCCFESSPRLKGGLGFSFMVRVIDEAIGNFPSLGLVVFTGGECFLLGEDLFSAIAYVAKKGLSSRCVTNGYWATSERQAANIARKLRESGLNEINISTGEEHRQWVPMERVLWGTEACLKEGLRAAIVFEGNENSQYSVRDFLSSSPAKNLMAAYPNALKIFSNVWIPFFKDSNVIHSKSAIRSSQAAVGFTGCGEVLENLVVTPHRKIASCCGLTMEHIPEMKIGDLNDPAESVVKAYERQKEDMMKLWLWVDGPEKILEFSARKAGNEYPKGIQHPCQACALVHLSEDIRRTISKHASEVAPDILLRVMAKSKLLGLDGVVAATS